MRRKLTLNGKPLATPDLTSEQRRAKMAEITERVNEKYAEAFQHMADHPVEHKCAARTGCKNLATTEPHSCPFAEEINDNYSLICYCCSECESECCQDI